MIAKCIAAMTLLLVVAAPAAAQTNELGGGFACQEWLSGFCDAKGFSVDFARAVHTAPATAMSIFGDFGWTRFTGIEDDMTFVGGVRERFFRTSRISPFAQASAGIVYWTPKDTFYTSGTDFIVGGGGGVQYRINDHFDAKAEINFWGAMGDDNWDLITRFSAGGVYKFGKR